MLKRNVFVDHHVESVPSPDFDRWLDIHESTAAAERNIVRRFEVKVGIVPGARCDGHGIAALHEILDAMMVRPLAASLRKPLMRIIDLSLPIDDQMRGVAIRSARRLEDDGWNATTLELYSHAGTHMDAPRHFLPDGATLDRQDLGVG